MINGFVSPLFLMALLMGNWGYNPTYRGYNSIYSWLGPTSLKTWNLFFAGGVVACQAQRMIVVLSQKTRPY